MKTFYLTMDVNIQVEVPIQANNLEEAINKAKNEDYELPNLNDSYIGETYMRYIKDENYNLLKEFEDN